MSDRDRLWGYVEIWRRAVDDLLDLLDSLPDDAWSTPTDLPGWDVRAVAAHTAHLERVLATGEEEHAEIGEPAHVRSPMGHYTEIGVVNRRQTPPAAIVAEIRDSAAARYAALRADPPTDAAAPAERVFAGIGWSWETLLRNRPLDVWMHEQDVRRAVGRPGNLDSPAARHTVDYLAAGLGFVLAKRVGAPLGSTAVLEVEGSDPVAVEIGTDGRGRALATPPAAPTLTLHTDRESFVLLAGGRRDAAAAVRIGGDADLGRRVVANLATTP